MNNSTKILRVGTRGSLLAVTQTHLVLDMLKSVNPNLSFDIRIIKTSGDEGKIEVVGAFVKEVEHALKRNEIDLAVHSLKDMPVALPPGVKFGALPPRGQACDCLISRDNKKLFELPAGAVVGTSSLRRVFQLKLLRPDLQIMPLRGNIITRMNKIENLEVDAVVLAAAGIERVNMADRIAQVFSYEEMTPAVAQGILAVEVRDDNDEVFQIVNAIHSIDSEKAAVAERTFLAALGGGCRMPIGAITQIEGNTLQLSGMLSDEKGEQIEYDKVCTSVNEPEEAGKRLAEKMLAKFGTNPL